MPRPKIRSSTDQRQFTMIYHDFLTSDLDFYEKIVFITLKMFADKKNQCFPSIKTLSNITGISRRKVQDTLKKLEMRNVITIKSRRKSDGSLTSNLYVLNDFKETWNGCDNEEQRLDLSEVSDEALLAEIERRKKEKKAETVPAKTQNQALECSTTEDNHTINSSLCQVYDMEYLKKKYEYDIMISDNPDLKRQIEGVLELIYDTINTEQDYIRVQRTKRPKDVVIQRLLKLTYEEVIYVIRQYQKQTARIKNQKAYILSQLYTAASQFELDVSNKVKHDMYYM